MKATFKKTSLALAVAALFASPIAFADGQGSHIADFKIDAAANLSLDTNQTSSDTSVQIDKKVKLESDLKVKGEVRVNGNITIDASSVAIVNDQQINYMNNVSNDLTTNQATINGNALNNASGNIGVNVTSGDNNQQANSAALSAADASFVFGSSDAELFVRQDAQLNRVGNLGNTNSASISGNAFANASGNIGVNVSSGSSNQQKNDLAASVAVARMATATVSVKQMNDHNSTTNAAKIEERVGSQAVSLNFNATGKTSGIVDQNGNQYPDTWTGTSHPSGSQTGHIDLDDSVQGASNRPVHSALDSNGNPTGPTSTGGALSFNEEGDVAMSGTVTGNIPVVYHVSLATTNTSSLGDNAFQNASGNIGVNIASGTNNQQYNGLAISATQAGAGNGGGGERRR